MSSDDTKGNGSSVSVEAKGNGSAVKDAAEGARDSVPDAVEPGDSEGQLPRAEGLPDEGGDHERRFLEFLRRTTANVRRSQLARLVSERDNVFTRLGEIPDRMQKLTNQVRLLFELVNDYWEGRYRQVRWYSLGIAVAAALYFVHPTDLIPDALPGVGHLDDVLVIALALRMVRKDMRAYIEWRGLNPEDYF